MKAGILTFFDSPSYGAVLQAFALQRTLTSLGLPNELVALKGVAASAAERPAFSSDTSAPAQPGPVSFSAAFAPAQPGPAPVPKPLARLLQAEEAKRAALFGAFRAAHLRISAPYGPGDYGKLGEAYDLFITGSDQVWNLRVEGAGPHFFLPFAQPQKRLSYAASFGGEPVPDRARTWCAGELSAFALLSVREMSGQAQIRELTGRTAEVSLDPVLLMRKEEWERIAAKKTAAAEAAAEAAAGNKDAGQGTDGQPFFLLYMLRYDPRLAALAEMCAKERGYGLRVVTDAFLPRFGAAAFSGTGVAEFLAFFRDAQGVFTNSFHGTAFSLLFGKPLKVSPPPGPLSSRAGRITELLALFGAEEAFGEGLFPTEGRDTEKQFQRARDASFAYLERVVRYAEEL